MHKRFVSLIPLFTFLSIALAWYWSSTESADSGNLSNPAFVLDENGKKIKFDLVDPAQAPAAIRQEVLEGYHLLQFTKEKLPEYAGDYISCSNCHFNAGDTLGGPANGISLVGVAYAYPRSIGNGHSITLAQRINQCFERSLNGKPLPEDAPAMRSMLAYLAWISQPVKGESDLPWLGIKMINKQQEPDLARGEEVFHRCCAMCHGKDGAGDPKVAPPLWGDHSFNDGAGMNRLPMLASFVHWNMPFDEPMLSEQEAWDVALFIINKPRPKYVQGQ